ncbi:S9 family peptidase [Sphingomonas limnosediminicola]|uniref:S9 family peptidase n=1 Tax=Sphingomonas limnosediminicola TaxID=940133 RepID=A0ABP7LKT9_9SPHN
MRKSVLISGLALFASARGLAGPLPDAVPIEAFAELPTIESPDLSPDGTKIVAKIAVRGKQVLLVKSLFGGAPVSMAQSDIDINWWRWVNNDWIVVGVGDEVNLYGEDLYATSIVGVSADMKKMLAVDPQRTGLVADDVIWIAQDGSPRLLLSKETGIKTESEWYPSVFDVDISTGKAKQVVYSHDGVWNWSADSNGVVRYGVIWDEGKKRGGIYRASASDDFHKIKLAGREADSIPEPVVFRTDGTALAFDDGEGRDALYEMELPTFKLGKKVFGDDRYDVDTLVATAAGNDVAAVGIARNRKFYEWFDPYLKEIQGDLDKSLGPGNARIVSWNCDRKKLLVEVGDPSQAGAIYYWDTDFAEMQRISWNSEILTNRKLSQVSTVRYKARDGTNIEAVLTMPRGRSAKNLPLIVMPHGGPGARDSEEYDWWSQFLAEQGYVVIKPNYRGSTGYGTAFHDLGNGQWGLKMQDDLIDAITHLADQGVIDPKRVCIVGGSYGGYAAMRAAQRDFPHYRCAVSYAGISDLGAMLRYDRNLLGKGVESYWKKQASDFSAVSPRFHAAEFGAPILIAHGIKDKRVPVKQSRMLVSELQKAGKPYEYLEQKLGDHHFSRSEDRLEFLKKLKAFLDKYNPA